MKKQGLFIVGVLVAVLGVVGMGTVHAEDVVPDVLTDEQRALIMNNCSDIQTTLNRIYQNDKLARHDLGLVYRSIVDKLMSPLNQRIASIQLDGGSLVQVTANSSAEYTVFFNAYRDYEQALQAAMQTDCTKQPSMFYDAITSARQKRAAVYESCKKLVGLAEAYYGQFTSFKASRGYGVKQ